ncbi:MAG: integrase core domain-containing protein [Gaiellaceae bacterium]
MVRRAGHPCRARADRQREGLTRGPGSSGRAASASSAATRASTARARNGKAERFIQTLLTEWGYARSYPSSVARARALGGYLRWYNRRRPHSSLGARSPISASHTSVVTTPSYPDPAVTGG